MSTEKEIEKAFGGCRNCYGKGYATTIEYAVASGDFEGEKDTIWQLPEMRFCSCDRGKALRNQTQRLKEGWEKEVREKIGEPYNGWSNFGKRDLNDFENGYNSCYEKVIEIIKNI